MYNVDGTENEMNEKDSGGFTHKSETQIFSAGQPQIEQLDTSLEFLQNWGGAEHSPSGVPSMQRDTIVVTSINRSARKLSSVTTIVFCPEEAKYNGIVKTHGSCAQERVCVFPSDSTPIIFPEDADAAIVNEMG